MAINANAPWHKQSFDAFIKDSLPRLLAQRLPLSDYRAESSGEHTCRVSVSVSEGSAQATVIFENIPQPSDDGSFNVDGNHFVVVPTASSEDLDTATIQCVGEQLYDEIEQRLGKAPAGLPWDEDLLRSFLPLDSWIREFVAGRAEHWNHPEAWSELPPSGGQELDEENWLSRATHLRRLTIPDRKKLITPSQFGRVCPFETPEGNNIGRVLSIAVGAAIENGKLVILDRRPEAALGLTASMVPFLEHNDTNRQLFGVNMMRQACVPPEPEASLVQTGNELSEGGFWCGRNLLTAFVSWGPETYEDGLLISESAARRLDFPGPLGTGDKLSNRHGAKGTVARIVPDDQMPHLADGTAVELVCNFIGLHTRLNFGQIREAIWGRIAKAEGKAAIVPPFHAPSQDEQRQRLARAGLPESGMETLTLGRGGPKLQRPSTIGWIYWYKLCHLAVEKLHASVGVKKCNYQGQLEYFAMRETGAFETIAETFNTRSVDRPDAESLAHRVAAGKVEQAGPPSPKLSKLVDALDMAGIRAELKDGRMTFAFAKPGAKTLALACPIAHPWLPEQQLTSVGVMEGNARVAAVVEANDKLRRLLAGQAPQGLKNAAIAQLSARVGDYLTSLMGVSLPVPTYSPPLTPDCMAFGNRVMFSGRTVLSPGLNLRLDQVGLADEIAWTLFGPLVVREGVGEQEVADHSSKAARVLDEVMARSWVILNRAPTIMPTCLLAFHPVRIVEKVIRIHPLACYLMNADFDGDQAAVFLPVTDQGQREAEQLLSIAGHLRRDPSLITWLAPMHEMLWGLAWLGRSSEGMKQIAGIFGTELPAGKDAVTKQALQAALKTILSRDGVDAAMDVAQRLMRLGFDAAKASGASMSPLIGQSLRRSPEPDTDAPGQWERYSQQLAERVAGCDDYDDIEIGPQLLAVRSGARGSVKHILNLVGSRGTVSTSGALTEVIDPNARQAIIRHGLAEGLTPAEMFSCTVGARIGLGQTALDCSNICYGVIQANVTKGFNVLARAMRAEHPGYVFAQATASGEVDPLKNLDSRLFVGLRPGD